MKIRLIGMACVRGALERGGYVMTVAARTEVLSSL
jgi:ubiquitin C-terminal hydrolase